MYLFSTPLFLVWHHFPAGGSCSFLLFLKARLVARLVDALLLGGGTRFASGLHRDALAADRALLVRRDARSRICLRAVPIVWSPVILAQRFVLTHTLAEGT